MPRSKYRKALIVSALPLEMAAAILRFTGRLPERVVSGYEYDAFLDESGNRWKLRFVTTGVGNVLAAIKSLDEALDFKPDIVIFVGIAGGRKDVGVGDVVIADRVSSYESAKVGEDRTTSRPRVINLDTTSLEHARSLAIDPTWYSRMSDLPLSEHGVPKIIVGPIASGEKVVANAHGQDADHISLHYSDTVAIDMESYGFAASVAYLTERMPGIRWIVVRGISDLLSNKEHSDSRGSQELAAAHAAAVARQLLSTYPTSYDSKPVCIWKVLVAPAIQTIPDMLQLACFLRERIEDSELTVVDFHLGSNVFQMRSNVDGYQPELHLQNILLATPSFVPCKVIKIEYVDRTSNEYQQRSILTQFSYAISTFGKMRAMPLGVLKTKLAIEFFSIPAVTFSIHGFIADSLTKFGLKSNGAEFDAALQASWGTLGKLILQASDYPVPNVPEDFRSWLHRLVFEAALPSISVVWDDNRQVQLALLQASLKANGRDRLFVGKFLATANVSQAAHDCEMDVPCAIRVLWQMLHPMDE